MPKIEERRFVAFDVAAIAVDLIVAIVGAVQKIGGINEPVVIIILDTGVDITLHGESKDAFIFWWGEKMKGLVEKVDLPVQAPVAPVAPVAQPVITPEPVPEPTVETVVPNIVSEVASQVAPEPPPPQPVVQAPNLSEIGKT